MTPLSFAALQGHTEVVQLLIDAGANLDAQTTLHQYTALMGGPLEAACAIALIEAGAALNLKNCSGLTALDEAVLQRRIIVVQALLEAGAQFDKMTIRRAEEMKQLEILRLFEEFKKQKIA